MTTEAPAMRQIPAEHELDGLLAALAWEDRELLLATVESGQAVRNPEQAALAVAVARRRKHHALVRDLPFYAGSAVLAAVIGYAVTGASAAIGFGLVVGGVLFVGFLWWGETYRPRCRAHDLNLAIVETGVHPGEKGAHRSRGSEWGMAVTLAWIVALAVNSVLHFVLDAPRWIGLPVFPAAVLLFHRLIARTVDEIDEWGKP